MEERDINSLQDDDRKGCMFTRGQSLQLLAHIAHSYEIDRAESEDWDSLESYLEEEPHEWESVEAYQEYVIAQQCGMIYRYKRRVDGQLSGAPGCTLHSLELQLRGVAKKGTRLAAKIKSNLDEEDKMSEDDGDMTLPKLGASLVRKTAVKKRQFGTYQSVTRGRYMLTIHQSMQ